MQPPGVAFGGADGLGIYDENPNPILRVSNDGIILYANRGSHALCGEWGGYVGDPVPETHRRWIIEAIESGTSRSYEEKIDGTIFLLQVVPVVGRDYVNIFGHAINPVQNSGVTYNIGDRHHLRNEQIIKRRNDFARIAVHELRTPLTPILAASEMLVNRLEDGITARLARQINNGAIELNARIGELFDLVRADLGTLVLVYQPVQLGDVLTEIAVSLRPSMETRGVILLIDTDDALPQINADRERLLEGLLYLVDSAIKRCQNKARVSVRVTSDSKSITIQVHVVCPRIPDELRNYLSAPYTALGIDREHFSSIGLKLTLSKKLIELHGGSIRVTGNKDDNTFIVNLPV